MSKATKSPIVFKSFSLTSYFQPLLLALLFRWPGFCFSSFGNESLAIGGVESRDREVAVGFSGCFL